MLATILLLVTASQATGIGRGVGGDETSLLRSHSAFNTKTKESPVTPDINDQNDQGVRIYENINNGIELGVHHPSSIDIAAGVAVASKRAALAYLSSRSGTGMTGMGATGMTGMGATGSTGSTGLEFDYNEFNDDVDKQSEKTLVRLFDTTKSALAATRDDVLGRHGLQGPTGIGSQGETGSSSTGSSSTGSSSTGSFSTGSTGTSSTGSAMTGGNDAMNEIEGATGTATGGDGSLDMSSTTATSAGSAKQAQAEDQNNHLPPQQRLDLPSTGHYKWMNNAGDGETDVRHQMLKGVH